MSWRRKRALHGVLAGTMAGLCGLTAGLVEEVTELSAFPVYAGTAAEESGVVRELTERMDREVRVDLQRRGGSAYQTDISIRGGIFEGTGLMIGGLALFDPQTGHYFSEIPLDPGFFNRARLLTGVENAVSGFNATAGSIDWEWKAPRAGGEVAVTAGSHRRVGSRFLSGGSAGRALWEFGAMRETGEGSVEGGDFDLERVSGRMEYPLGAGRLRLFGGFLEKFYGWPGMYTGFPSLLETDAYSVSLLGAQWESGDRDFGNGRQAHRVGGYWRRLDDDYEFNRLQPNRLFEHLTEVWSLQGDGFLEHSGWTLSYRWVLLRDALLRSTSLVNGGFDERDYAKGSLLASRNVSLEFGGLTLHGGLVADHTSEEGTAWSPQAGVALTGITGSAYWKAFTTYSEATRVPGYTVLNSAPSGLFGGNPGLGRETARSWEAGVSVDKDPYSLRLVVFQRRDRDLVDWVYDSASPSARQAAAMNLTVRGLETSLGMVKGPYRIEAAYAWLEKDPVYRSEAGDASFYALNHARHRVLLSIERKFARNFRMRLEGEYRRHPDNLLRAGGDQARYLHLFAIWEGFPAEGWSLEGRLENLTREDFQPLPGTPGPGRTGWVTLRATW